VTAAKTAGYSRTPLAKKLGIGTGHRVWLVNAPANYKTLVSPLPDGVTFVSKASNTTDIAHVFTTKRREMEKTLRAGARDTRAGRGDLGVVAEEGVEGRDRHHRRCDPRGRAAHGLRRYQGLRG
jgi:hypothetical protein